MKRPLLFLCSLAVSSAWAATPSRHIKFVEYIESSGTQCIDTGFSPTNKNVRLEMTYRFVSLPAEGSRKYVFGTCQDNTQNVRFQYAVGSAGNSAFGFGKGWISNATVDSYDIDTTHTIVCDGGVFSLDGNMVQDLSTSTYENPHTKHSLYLFANNNKGSTNSVYYPSMRLYSCRIWDNGVLVRDFHPVLVDGVTACLYDIAKRKFYENAGTGSFTVGEEVPMSYRKANYIEANRTAYIDTGYVPNANTELEMEFAFTEELDMKTYVFGSYGVSSKGRFMMSYGPASTGCFLGYGAAYTNSFVLPYNTERHVVKYVPGSGKGFYFDGDRVDPPETNLTNWDGTGKYLFLGQVNRNGESLIDSYFPPIRIYSCKIWENGTPKRDLVPRQRVLDGKNGLYDNVTGNFYAYYGSGADFTAFIPPPGSVILIY